MTEGAGSGQQVRGCKPHQTIFKGFEMSNKSKMPNHPVNWDVSFSFKHKAQRDSVVRFLLDYKHEFEFTSHITNQATHKEMFHLDVQGSWGRNLKKISKHIENILEDWSDC